MEFLQWALPRLRLRWEGFRKVRRQVCKRLMRRIEELGLSCFSAYREYLDRGPEEWQVVDYLCAITISRFYRDRKVFDILRERVLPRLANDVVDEGGNELRCWSAGCSSGEEPYTLQIIWRMGMSPQMNREISLRMVATDMNKEMLERAKQGLYRPGSFRDLPEELRDAFTAEGDLYSVKPEFRENIEFLKQDIRRRLPDGTFHLILCRNLVFTYFAEDLQREIFERILAKLRPEGILVVGAHESVPAGAAGVRKLEAMRAILQRETAGNLPN